MPENEKLKIADQAAMIVRGFAFVRKGELIQIVNLNQSTPHVALIDQTGKIMESNMDAIEEAIALDIWNSDSEFMEEADA